MFEVSRGGELAGEYSYADGLASAMGKVKFVRGSGDWEGRRMMEAEVAMRSSARTVMQRRENMLPVKMCRCRRGAE